MWGRCRSGQRDDDVGRDDVFLGLFYIYQLVVFGIMIGQVEEHKYGCQWGKINLSVQFREKIFLCQPQSLLMLKVKKE